MPATDTDWEVLSAKLVARILHDIASPASGLASAIDLLAEEAAPREEAAALARESLTRIADRIAFCRAAFGGGAVSAAELPRLAQMPFVGGRCRLEPISVPETLPDAVGRASLILAQILAEALFAGGTAMIEVESADGVWRILARAQGAKVRIHPEAAEGLRGEPLTAGLPGRWAPARYLHALANRRGGRLEARLAEGEARLTLTLPKGPRP